MITTTSDKLLEFLRFWNNEILQQTDAVLALVLAKLRELN